MSPRPPLAIAVHSAFADRIHYALVLAAAAAAVDRPVTLFFTMGACRALVPGGWPMLVTEDGRSATAFDDALAAAGVATFETLAESCLALDVRFLACDSGLRALGIEPEALRSELRVELAGAFTYLQSGAAGDLLFI